MYSCVPEKPNWSLFPLRFITIGKLAIKFLLPNILSQSNFNALGVNHRAGAITKVYNQLFKSYSFYDVNLGNLEHTT